MAGGYASPFIPLLALLVLVATAGCSMGPARPGPSEALAAGLTVTTSPPTSGPARETVPPSPPPRPTPTPTPRPLGHPKPPDPALRIVIEKIDLDSPIQEIGMRLKNGQWEWEAPDHAVGHYIGTANPGERGNIVLSGHISSPGNRYGNVFARLGEVEPGDLVKLYTESREFVYRVRDRRILVPTDTRPMEPTREPILTLLTCWPDRIYSHRLVLTAVPVKGT